MYIVTGDATMDLRAPRADMVADRADIYSSFVLSGVTDLLQARYSLPSGQAHLLMADTRGALDGIRGTVTSCYATLSA